VLTSARVNTLYRGLAHARIGSILRLRSTRYVLRVYVGAGYCPDRTVQSRLRARVQRRERRLQSEGFTTKLLVVPSQSSGAARPPTRSR
jgi:hypothetical protein